jgi:hypothetical protein
MEMIMAMVMKKMESMVAKIAKEKNPVENIYLNLIYC